MKVEIAGRHDCFTGELGSRWSEFGAHVRLDRPEAELLFELPLYGYFADILDERQLDAKARLAGANVAAEPEDDTDLLRLDLLQRAEAGDQQQDHGGDPLCHHRRDLRNYTRPKSKPDDSFMRTLPALVCRPSWRGSARAEAVSRRDRLPWPRWRIARPRGRHARPCPRRRAGCPDPSGRNRRPCHRRARWPPDISPTRRLSGAQSIL